MAAIIREGPNVVWSSRAVIGHTDSTDCPQHHQRYFSMHISRNIVHSSNSMEGAQLRFQSSELVDWQMKATRTAFTQPAHSDCPQPPHQPPRINYLCQQELEPTSMVYPSVPDHFLVHLLPHFSPEGLSNQTSCIFNYRKPARTWTKLFLHQSARQALGCLQKCVVWPSFPQWEWTLKFNGLCMRWIAY